MLAGSLRDDGPLPDTITDMNEAQDAYAKQLEGAGLVMCLGSMLHSIATGNMLPSWVKLSAWISARRSSPKFPTAAPARRSVSSPMSGCFWKPYTRSWLSRPKPTASPK